MDFIQQPGSYVAIFVALLLTGAGLPVPEEAFVVTAGVLAAAGKLDPWLALATCVFGALASDCIMYAVGRHFGRGLLQRHPWWIRFITPEREAQVEEMFQRHGLKVFFAARFLVLLRSPLLLAGGILRVSFVRFFLIDLLSATVVVGSFFGLSYLCGQAVGQWIRTTEVLLTIAAVVVITVVALYIWRRHRRKLASTQSASRDNIPSLPDDSEKPEDKVEQVV
jgi:membrane protein DedA with SNARE-associated domain